MREGRRAIWESWSSQVTTPPQEIDVVNLDKLATSAINAVTPIIQKATLEEVKDALNEQGSWDALWVRDYLDDIMEEYRNAH